MNIDRESIIRMARESGFDPHDMSDDFTCNLKDVERFAALVAAATAKEYEERLRFTQERWEIECKSQVEIEREACAKVCEAHGSTLKTAVWVAEECAAAIRARGETK